MKPFPFYEKCVYIVFCKDWMMASIVAGRSGARQTGVCRTGRGAAAG